MKQAYIVKWLSMVQKRGRRSLVLPFNLAIFPCSDEVGSDELSRSPNYSSTLSQQAKLATSLKQTNGNAHRKIEAANMGLCHGNVDRFITGG